MINSKYYSDIKDFPNQFEKGIAQTKGINIVGDYTNAAVFGVGGSSLFIELINDYLSTFSPLRLNAVRGYEVPNYITEKTLCIAASHSGNTEETISAIKILLKRGLQPVVFTSGGRLMDIAQNNNLTVFEMPRGIQPRLTTGHFISGILIFLKQAGLIEKDVENDLVNAAKKIDSYLNEDLAKTIAQRMNGKTVINYAANNSSSIARISKIKFNENSKTQSFWNEIPEMNHNEMVGFTNLVLKPFFLIFKSKFTNERNIKRIEIFAEMMKEQGNDIEVFEMKGENILEEILSTYYFVDHITFYLAEVYGIDPEPVAMVEDFKKRMV